MENRFYNLFNGILLIVVGAVIGLLVQDQLIASFGGRNSDVKIYKQLIEEGNTAYAIVDTNLTKTFIKIKDFQFGVYKVPYSFIVEEKVFSGKFHINHPDSLTSKIVNVHYLKNNPSINIVDVEEKLDTLELMIKSKSGLFYACLLGLISFGIVIYGVFILKTNAQRFSTNK